MPERHRCLRESSIRFFWKLHKQLNPGVYKEQLMLSFSLQFFHLRRQIPERCLLKVEELLEKWCRSNQTLFIQTPFNVENWISRVYSRAYLFYCHNETDTARNKWVDYAVMKCLTAVHSSICHVQWWGEHQNILFFLSLVNLCPYIMTSTIFTFDSWWSHTLNGYFKALYR